MKLERLLITCGGTGGHFYPGLAIAKAMKKRGGHVKLLLAGVNAQAQSAIAREQGIDSLILPAMAAPRKAPFRFLLGLIQGYGLCRKEIAAFSPQALLGMGAFTSLPAVLACKTARLPLYLHDGNARIGRANRMLSCFARFLAAAFPPVNGDKIKCPIVETGMPIREILVESAETIDRKKAIEELNALYHTDLLPDAPTILIFGGSQGAAVFNAALPEGLLQLNSSEIQVLHLTGRNKLESTLAAYKDAPFKTLITESSEKMELFWSAADMVFSRSGGSSIAEMALFGCPGVLVPYPFAAENHQMANAAYFAEADAGVLLDNYELSPENSRELLADFLNDRAKWSRRGQNAKSLARPGAASCVLDKIEENLQNK